MVYYNYIFVIKYEYHSKNMFYKVQNKLVEYFSPSR